MNQCCRPLVLIPVLPVYRPDFNYGNLETDWVYIAIRKSAYFFCALFYAAVSIDIMTPIGSITDE
jgi:hypothetical protein